MAIDFTMTEEQELLLSSIRELINNEFPEEYFRTHDAVSYTHLTLPTTSVV